MSAQIDYYFTSLSPFTYLGHRTFMAIAAAANASVRFKPVKLGQVFAASGALPLPKRSPSRQAYRLLELSRWAAKRGLPINPQPAFFPTDPALADHCIIALQEQGLQPDLFVGSVLAACWAEDLDIADQGVIQRLLSDQDLDVDQLISVADSDAIEAIYDRNTEQAIAEGVLGAPAYLLDGEQFWGQDRLELLAEALLRR